MHVTNIQRYLAASVFCVLGAAFVVLITASTTLRYRAPDVAVKIWPWNGEARGSLAGRKLVSGDVLAGRKLAIRAVRQVPGDVVSLRAFGMTQPVGGLNHEVEIMKLATRASRRDLPTNLWFIEYYVSRNDIANAIRYYDYSLKSSADSEKLLFPVLLPAMTDPKIASAVQGKLIARPIWTTSFLQYGFASGASDDALIGIVLTMSHDRIGLPVSLQRQYAQRLSERGNFAGLERLARGLGSPLVGGAAKLDRVGNLPPADWRLMSEPGLSTFANPASGFSFVSSQNGVLAERILRLTAGQYLLSNALHMSNENKDLRLAWSMVCLPSGRPLPISAMGNRSALRVLSDHCPYQKVMLSLNSEDLADGIEVSGEVSNIRIERVN